MRSREAPSNESPVLSNRRPTYGPAVRARGLERRLGHNLAVAGVDLDVAPGEVVGLVGPNGAGKTTLLHLLAGLLAPDRGTVAIAGREDPTRPNVRAQLGFAPQATAVYDELSAEENLVFFGRLHGLSGAHLRARVEDCLAFAGLQARRRDRASTFSGGMRRRLHVAAALVHEPAVVLLDEPTVGVDAASRGLLLDGVAALRDRGRAVLYASHHLDEIARVCDRAVVLGAGKVVADDRIDRLLAEGIGGPSGHVDLEELLRAGGDA